LWWAAGCGNHTPLKPLKKDWSGKLKDYLSIKDFSEFSGIEDSTLRFWDNIGLFSPALRNKNNNYRYYSPQQIIAVNFITMLSKLKIPLKKINEIQRIRNPERILEMIERQEQVLDMEMQRLRENYSIIHIRRELIKCGMQANISEITIKKLPKKTFIMGPPTNFAEGGGFYDPFIQFCKEAKTQRVNLHCPIGAVHDSMESFLKAPGEPGNFISVDPTGSQSRKAGKYLVGYAQGYYGEFGDLPERMAKFAEENDVSCHGSVYTIYLHDEICVRDIDQYLSQISVAVKPK